MNKITLCPKNVPDTVFAPALSQMESENRFQTAGEGTKVEAGAKAGVEMRA